MLENDEIFLVYHKKIDLATILLDSSEDDEEDPILIMKSNSRKECSKFDKTMLFPDNLDEALLGVVKYKGLYYPLYDYETCIEILIEHFPDQPDEILETFLWDEIITTNKINKTPWVLI
jgi:SpoVK/Ycf46/Vps4 family AAA+-type ATPase